MNLHEIDADSRVRVIDNFLSSDGRRELFEFCNSEEYSLCHLPSVNKVWRLHDGLPLKGRPYYFTRGDVPSARRSSFYPLSKPIDQVFEALLPILNSSTLVIGEEFKDWNAIVASCFIYPAGSGLSLHTDGREKYSGGFIYYCHPTWNINWGGNLMLFSSEDFRGSLDQVGRGWLSDSQENELTFASGVATAILPKPDRLVIISPNTPHMITKVDAAAGMNPRVSISGFFLKPPKLK